MSAFERVKEIALQQGLTVRKLEEKAGLGTNSLYRWKKYNPSAESAKKVADVLGVSVDYLLGNTDEKQPATHSEQPQLDLREVSDDERYNLISAGGRPISDEDWAIIKAVLAKYPRHRK
ncbi:helix-turn-helix domain-containing protein [Pediococcus pentosaceus]|uniref:helix-turn-helix domain-containing protein n=1 Tax=Pediococcus pentosaceus TaxID=1255 RepID=UPI003981C478